MPIPDLKFRFRGIRLIILSVFTLCIAGIILAGSCTYTSDQAEIKGKDIRLTLLHTTDIHSRILPYEHAPIYTEEKLGMNPDRENYGGIARIGYVVKRERKRAGRVLHLDSGDLFQGAPIFNLFQGEPEIKTMTQVGLDAFVVGNHEFDAGAANIVEKFTQFAGFPVLSANYHFLDQARPFDKAFQEMVHPFAIFNLRGLKVGVIGMSNLSSMTSLEDGGNSSGIVALDTIQTVQDYVNILRPEVDVVILLSHLGLGEDELVARNVCGLDLILGGHHHIALVPPKVIAYDPDPEIEDRLETVGECSADWKRNVVLVHSQAFAKFVGRLDVVVRDGRVLAHKYDLIPIDSSVPEDPEVWETLEPYYDEMMRTYDLDRVIAHAKVDLHRFGNNGGDSMLGNFVAEAMQYRKGVETDFALTNSLGTRTDILQGPITVETMFNVMPFENTITTMYLSGIEVQEMLDFATRKSSSRGCNSQIQISNASFTMNCRDGVAEDIAIAGEPMRLDAIYEMATNNYIAWGGSGFKVLKRNTTKIDTGIPLREAVVQYMQDHPELPECFEPYDGDPLDEEAQAQYLETCEGYATEDGRIKAVF